MPKKPQIPLSFAISDEDGRHFETGIPVTFRFARNTEKSPNFGARFGQDIEPTRDGRQGSKTPPAKKEEL